MDTKKIKDLELGELFTLKPIENPRDSQVYCRHSYDIFSKKYECFKFSDFCDYRLFKGDKLVYVGFTF